MTDDSLHPCSQEVTLNTICMKITSIEEHFKKMSDIQERYVADMAAHNLEVAKYPLPADVWAADKMLNRHETYFKIFGAAMVGAWGLLLFLLDKWVAWGKP